MKVHNSGKGNLNLYMLKVIVSALDITVGKLIGEDDDEKNNYNKRYIEIGKNLTRLLSQFPPRGREFISKFLK